MRKINSDELGDKGENRFQELCSDARLTCNKASRDRTGWDFIVELPIDESDVSLDRRPPSWTCYVQLKTIWDDNDAIAVNLKMAERLAKQPNPSFILVLKVDNDLNFTSAYLLHMSGANLAKILKRLRQEDAKGDRQTLTRRKITFLPQKEEAIAVSGSAFLERMRSKLGADVFSDISGRQKEQSELGYEATPYEVTTTFPQMDVDKLLDIFLGVEQQFEIERVEVSETRFGITLPFGEPSSAKITIQPNPVSCVVSFVDESGRAPAMFQGGIISTPEVINGRKRTHVRTPALTVCIDSQKGKVSKLNLKTSFHGQHSPSVWANTWKAVSILRNGKCRMRVVQRGNETAELNIESNGFQNVPDLENCRLYQEAAIALVEICGAASLVPEPEFDFGHVGHAAHSIFALKAIIDGNTPAIKRSATCSDEDWEYLKFIDKLICAHRFEVGEICFAYYITGTLCKALASDAVEIPFEHSTLRHVETIDTSADAFSSFVERARAREGTLVCGTQHSRLSMCECKANDR
ncbi:MULTISPECIES: hypothetical protein [Paraburkholderia]|uniref:hypothetical protein n=1 Tax=Paraburkholderia TaxID=1822464 RepID=UPI0022510B6F|nr:MULTISPECIES: hypothetical protein [Paraburkholderia]MCX4153064.1 hypothetical protein [Paraburkholderia aspalathi]MDN7162478.1 hypothetical protein [Paraburkholderia sp. SECH2]MDQ6390964.1 hypothetical protein [Paraburkholderia aspalathi]